MTIPASRIVKVNPAVVAAGGSSLVLNGLFLTQSLLMPTKTVYNFASSDAVGRFFGFSSAEYSLSLPYFAGYVNSTVKPSGMLFAAYNATARAAFLTGGNLSGLTLNQLKALTGVITITVDGVAKTSSSINLSSATSFSNAATIMLAAFTTPGFSITWNATISAFVFTSSTTGATSTVTFATGSLATPLKLTQATGAFTSQGAVVDTPAGVMAMVVGISQNFATFTAITEPVTADKIAFVEWQLALGNRFLYVGWDSDPNASVQNDTTSFGYLIKQNQYDGVIAISGDPALAAATATTLAALALNAAAFFMGAIGSINFQQRNGRRNGAFMVSAAGIAPTSADDQISQNLLANGYNFYGSYATANEGFIFFYNGQLPGSWQWVDSYVNQIFLNSQFQLALLRLLIAAGSVPYTPAGYGMVKAAMQDPINDALDFGTIRVGQILSEAQKAEVNSAAGVDAASVIQTQGYYKQVLDPGADVRAERGTPLVNFWYADGGSIQHIEMASIAIL